MRFCINFLSNTYIKAALLERQCGRHDNLSVAVLNARRSAATSLYQTRQVGLR